ncbi:MAG: hypothetical protein ACRC3K_07925 [Plesiomonas sp.]
MFTNLPTGFKFVNLPQFAQQLHVCNCNLAAQDMEERYGYNWRINPNVQMQEYFAAYAVHAKEAYPSHLNFKGSGL